MSEIMSKPTMYSLIATGITFLALIIFYAVKKPSFVLEEDSNGKKVLSIRLSLVYSLLFSSTIGLLVLGVSGLLLKNKEVSSSSIASIELPTMGTSFKMGVSKGKTMSCCNM